MVLDRAKMFFALLRELAGQELLRQEGHVVPNPEVDEEGRMKDENEDAVGYRHLRPVKRSRLEYITFVLVFLLHRSTSRLLEPQCMVSPFGGRIQSNRTHRQLQGGLIPMVFCTVSVQ